MVQSQEFKWVSGEMREIDPRQVEIQVLGRVLEGRGQIKSSLEDSQLPELAGILKQCVRLIERPLYSSCGDGREVLRLAGGNPRRLQPRKFGASISPFNMRALADPGFLAMLERTGSAKELYAACDQTSFDLGNIPAGHFSCGAGDGIVSHNRTAAEMAVDSPNGRAVAALAGVVAGSPIAQEAIAGHFDAIRPQAARSADILEARGWNGADYVSKLAKRDGDSVEVLRTDNTPTHGHKEDFNVFVLSDTDENSRPLAGLDKVEVKKRTGLEFFGVDLSELARDAMLLGRDSEAQTRHLVAGLMHHVSVADHLADGSQPVIVLRVHKK